MPRVVLGRFDLDEDDEVVFSEDVFEDTDEASVGDTLMYMRDTDPPLLYVGRPWPVEYISSGALEDPNDAARIGLAITPDGWDTLDPEQRRNVLVIYRVMKNQGVPPRVIQAAVVNALRESDLRADAIGDNGNSVGLFQLNINGAGAGMTVAQRQDPAVNTQAILMEYHGPAGANIRKAVGNAATLLDIAALWTQDIERPADRPGEMRKSQAFAEFLFGPPSHSGIGIDPEDYPTFRPSGKRKAPTGGSDPEGEASFPYGVALGVGLLGLGLFAATRG